jgi:hypothetical protein
MSRITFRPLTQELDLRKEQGRLVSGGRHHGFRNCVRGAALLGGLAGVGAGGFVGPGALIGGALGLGAGLLLGAALCPRRHG